MEAITIAFRDLSTLAVTVLPQLTAKTPALHSEQLPPSSSPRESELLQTITRLEHAMTLRVLADKKRQRELDDAWGRVEILLRILEAQQKERERLVGVLESLEDVVARGLVARGEMEKLESKKIAAEKHPTELPVNTTRTSTTTLQVPSQLSVTHAPKTPRNDLALQGNNLVLSITKNTTTTTTDNKPNIQQPPTTQDHKKNGKQEQPRKTPAQQGDKTDRSAIKLPPGMSKYQRRIARLRIRKAPEALVEEVVAQIWRKYGDI